MDNFVKVIRKGVEDTMPKSIWDQLPANDKGGWELLVKTPKEVITKTDKVIEPKVEVVNEEGKLYPSNAPSDLWTVPQLVAYAKDNNIDLGRAKKEEAVLKKIKEAGH